MACKQVKASLSPVIQFKSCSFSARSLAISAIASRNAAGSGGTTSGSASETSEKCLGATAAELVSVIERAFDNVVRDHSDALFVLSDSLMSSNRVTLAQLA